MIPHNEMTTGAGDGALGPGQVVFDHDGVDLTLIRWMLSLTPADRREVLQWFVHSLSELRHEEADS